MSTIGSPVGLDLLAAECPRGLSATDHAPRTTIHVLASGGRVLCLDRSEKRRSLERTDAQVAADDAFRAEVQSVEATEEGAGFFQGLEAMGYSRSEAVAAFARTILRPRK